MTALSTLFEQHGLLTVGLGVLAEQLGAPLPALPLMVLAGVRAVADAPFAVQALVLATLASTLADVLWYAAGRRYGQRIMGLLCRVSLSPDQCVRQSELSFARHGALSLVLSKFVPGLSTVAPPMAGAIGMPLRRFVMVNLFASALWAASGLVLGALFHRELMAVLARLDGLGLAALVVIAGAAALYVAARYWRRHRLARWRAQLPRIEPAELHTLLQAGQPLHVLDVRGTALPGQVGIAGAQPVDLRQLRRPRALALPAQAELVTYCACPNDASAVQAAHRLRRHGYRVRVLHGGLGGWEEAGFPLAPGAAAS